MKINDIKESKQVNELDLSPLIGSYGKAKLDSVLGNNPGAKNIEDRMAMDSFIKKFIGNATNGLEQAVSSGLVAKTASAPTQAQASPQTTPQTTPAQATAQSPEEIRKQKLATNAAAAQQQMAANTVPTKAAPAVAPSPEEIRKQKQAAAAQAAQGQMAPMSKLPANQPAVQASNIRQQKQAAAAQAAQGQMAPVSKLPANQPAIQSQNIRQKKQANATATAQDQVAPVAKSAPVANKQPPGFNAQNVMKLPGMQKKVAKKVPAMAESAKFNRLNTLFENIVQETGQQSISQYIMGFFKKFMGGRNMDQKALANAMPQAEKLAKEAEASYPKMTPSLTKLAQLGWAVSHQQGEDEPVSPSQPSATPTVPSTTPSVTAPVSTNKSSSRQVQTTYKQIKSMLDKLKPNDKKNLVKELQKQLGNAPITKPATKATKTTNEPISIGGQKINPNDPLYAKLKKQMAGK